MSSEFDRTQRKVKNWDFFYFLVIGELYESKNEHPNLLKSNEETFFFIQSKACQIFRSNC